MPPQRQMAVFCADEALFGTVCAALSAKENSAVIGLRALRIGDEHEGRYRLKAAQRPLFYRLWTWNLGASSKKVAPLLIKILKASKL